LNTKEIEEFERALYRGKEHYFDIDSDMGKSGGIKWWPEIEYIYYEGCAYKSYSRPMFEVEAPYKCFNTEYGCLPCDSNSGWDYTYDVVVDVTSIPVFNEYGVKTLVPIVFDPDFAATARHP
jgi:hypothetical protein